MTSRKPLWDFLSDKEREDCLGSIIAYFQKERNEIIGVIAAQEFLDVVQEKVTWSAYNKGVEDAKTLLEDKFAGINIDLDLLRRQ
jgi:uncharacterized protein (DUF2164 family)